MSGIGISSPTDGDTLEDVNVELTWTRGTHTGNWRVWVSETAPSPPLPGGNEVWDSGIMPNHQLSCTMILPSEGETLYVFLFAGGSYDYHTYTAWTMPDRMRNNARTFGWYEQGRWYQCARCGWDFHESDMAIDPKSGLRVCTIGPHDYDDHEFGIYAVVLSNQRNPVYRGEQG